MPPPSSDSRRDAIREILSRQVVGTQKTQRRHLAARGIRAAQATLSRDMALLGVRRIAGAGGPRYRIDGDDGGLPMEPVRRMVDTVESNAVMVVVRTKAGAASAVARALDEARLPELLGTLAGDDTVFVVPATAQGGHALARKLRRILGAG
jgi:transcriptional regulator of arginine metabolism